MHPLIQSITSSHSPETLAAQLQSEPGVVLLRSGSLDSPQARYSFVVARPFLTFRSFDARCELHASGHLHVQFGNPWRVLGELVARHGLLEELGLAFPPGGCFWF